jgi:hypothetical protein
MPEVTVIIEDELYKPFVEWYEGAGIGDPQSAIIQLITDKVKE